MRSVGHPLNSGVSTRFPANNWLCIKRTAYRPCISQALHYVVNTLHFVVRCRMASLIRSATLTGFLEVAHSVGLNLHEQLNAVGLDVSSLSNPDRKIPASAVAHLLENAAAASGNEDFGLRMAEYRRLSVLGPLALLVREQATLRRALTVIQCNYRMHNEGLLLLVEEHANLAILRGEQMTEEIVSGHQATQLRMGMLYRTLRSLLGGGWVPQRICFQQQAPRDRSRFSRLFGMPVEFGCDLDGIVCHAQDLDAPLPLADAQLAHYLDQHLVSLIEASNESIAGKVRRIVWTLLPQGQCTAVRVAGQLGVERTTLHRQLAQSDQSFSKIVDAVRAEMVPRYLANPERPLTDIATLLGFSSLSTFSRWFKLRYGKSPSCWRQIAGAGQPR